MGRISHQRLFLAAALLVALAAAWPLLAEPGLLNTRGGGDSPFLLQRLQQLETAVRDGHFPARWMPDANYGYGYPFYNFYAPLSIYITLLFRFAGFSYVRAIQLSQLAGFLVAAAGMFALGRRWFKSAWAGLVASIAYTVAPFHMVNIYVRGDALAEFWAMAFYPLVIGTVDTVFSHQRSLFSRRQAVAVMAVVYAALILSHNISALIFSPFLLLYILLRWLFAHRSPPTDNHVQHGRAAIVRIIDYGSPVVAGLLLAFALAAWFFLPALVEKDTAQLGPVTEGYFHFSNHFLGANTRPLLQNSLFFDYRVDGLEAFRMGLVQAVTIAVGVGVMVVTWRRRDGIRPYRRHFILLVLVGSTLMLLPLSRLLWERLPLLAFTQFPWRFLSVQAFAGALAAGALAAPVTPLPGRRVVALVTAVLLIIAALGRLKTDHLILTDADVTAERLAYYEWFTGNIGTTVSAEYLPHTVQPRMVTSAWLHSGERWPVRALAGDLPRADLLAAKTTWQKWVVTTASPAALTFPTIQWPGWEARLDGQKVATRPSPGAGLITLDVAAAGEHIIELHLRRTPIRLGAELLSLTAAAVLIWLLRPARGASWGRLKRDGVYGLAALSAVFLVTLIIRLWPAPTLTNDDLTWDFAQMAYLHHAPEGVLFGNGLTLQHYQYSQEQLAAGDTLTVTTAWAGPTYGSQATLQLVTPASSRYQEPAPPVIAEASQLIGHDRTVFTLTIPHNAPAGLVVPRLLLADAGALTPSGQERGALFLRPLHLKSSAAQHTDPPTLDVKALRVTQPMPDTLAIELAWTTAVPLSQNYNVALRLTDAQGQFLSLADMQPGYGFQPSTLWPAGTWVNDWLALGLPADEHEAPYVLLAQLYDVAVPHMPVLTRRLGEVWPQGEAWAFQATEPLYDLPEGIAEATAVFNGNIWLHGYTLAPSADMLQVNLYWKALAPTSADFTRFVHLIPANSSQPPLAQDDNQPRNGTYPTSQWTEGEVIEESVRLEAANLPSGAYQLAVGFYERFEDGTVVRATAVDVHGALLPDNQFILPEIITIP